MNSSFGQVIRYRTPSRCASYRWGGQSPRLSDGRAAEWSGPYEVMAWSTVLIVVTPSVGVAAESTNGMVTYVEEIVVDSGALVFVLGITAVIFVV